MYTSKSEGQGHFETACGAPKAIAKSVNITSIPVLYTTLFTSCDYDVTIAFIDAFMGLTDQQTKVLGPHIVIFIERFAAVDRALANTLGPKPPMLQCGALKITTLVYNVQ